MSSLGDRRRNSERESEQESADGAISVGRMTDIEAPAAVLESSAPPAPVPVEDSPRHSRLARDSLEIDSDSDLDMEEEESLSSSRAMSLPEIAAMLQDRGAGSSAHPESPEHFETSMKVPVHDMPSLPPELGNADSYMGNSAALHREAQERHRMISARLSYKEGNEAEGEDDEDGGVESEDDMEAERMDIVRSLRLQKPLPLRRQGRTETMQADVVRKLSLAAMSHDKEGGDELEELNEEEVKQARESGPPRLSNAYIPSTDHRRSSSESDDNNSIMTSPTQYTIGNINSGEHGQMAEMAQRIRKEKDTLVTGSVPRQEYQAEQRSKSDRALQRRASSSFDSLGEMGTFRTIMGRRTESAAFVIILGVVAATADYLTDECIRQLSNLSSFLQTLPDQPGYKLLVSVCFKALLAVGAASAVQFISPLAAGSGIAEAKFILGGDVHRDAARLLPLIMVLAKVIGLTLAAGSGMIVGREGPFVHTSIGIAQALMTSIPYFANTNANGGLKRQVFAAACAVGVSSTFTSPIGGLLFSIEVTSTYYLVANYWKGFLCAICGAVVVRVIILIRNGSEAAEVPFFDSEVDASNFTYAELPLFAALGVFLGCAGAAYVRFDDWTRRCITHIQASPNQAKKQDGGLGDSTRSNVNGSPASSTSSSEDSERWNWRRIKIPKLPPILLAGIGGVVTAIVYFYTGDFNSLNLFTLMDQLLSTEPLGSDWRLFRTENASISIVLLVFLGTRLLLTAVTTNLKFPSGNFIPCFIIGAAFGRLVAILLSDIFPGYTFSPAGYALCCGAGFTAAITHTISTAVIALEFTGAFEYQIPIFITVIVAFGIAIYAGDSLYDMKMKAKNMKYLPALKGDNTFNLTARDVMTTELIVLTRKTQLWSIVEALKAATFSAFPIVDSSNNNVFLGCVSRRALVRFLYFHALKNNMEELMKMDLPRDLRPRVCEELERSFGRVKEEKARGIFRNIFTTRGSTTSRGRRWSYQEGGQPTSKEPVHHTFHPSMLIGDRTNGSAQNSLSTLSNLFKNTLTLGRSKEETSLSYPSLSSLFVPPQPEDGGKSAVPGKTEKPQDVDKSAGGDEQKARSKEETSSSYPSLSSLFVPPPSEDGGKSAVPGKTEKPQDVDQSAGGDEEKATETIPAPPSMDSPDSAPMSSRSTFSRPSGSGWRSRLWGWTLLSAEQPKSTAEAADTRRDKAKSQEWIRKIEEGAAKERQRSADGINLETLFVSPNEESKNQSVTSADMSHTTYIKHMKRVRVNLREHKEILIDPSPFRVSEYMPLEQIHILFEMLRCSRVFVTSYGILVGVISRDLLIESLSGKIAECREFGFQHAASMYVRRQFGFRMKR